MKVKVIATAKDTNSAIASGQTVVVIDVLRASSVITTALANGSGPIWPVLSIEEAFEKRKAFPNDRVLLGGERGSKIIPGFDLGNSPFSYSPDKVNGKNIIISTTNGTRAIRNSMGAKALYMLAFLNLPFAAKKMSGEENIVLVCSGTNDQFSADDALCAGHFILELEKYTHIETDDLGLVVRSFALQNGSIAEKLDRCFHLNYLKSIGYQHDVDYCLQIGDLNILPVLHTNGYLTKLED